jgi:hypothetical protein
MFVNHLIGYGNVSRQFEYRKFGISQDRFAKPVFYVLLPYTFLA